MGVFGAVFGCRGDAGFRGPLLGASSGVVGFNVATLSRLVREKLRPARPDVRASAKKFALRAHNGPKLAFSGVLGEFFCGRAAGGAVLGEFFSRQPPLCRSWMQRRALQAGCRWGFCTIRSSLAACRGSNDAIPPLRGGGAAVRGGVVAKMQTHWVKNAENSLCEVNGSALWRIWWVWTHRLRYPALQVRWMRVGSCSWAPQLAPVTRYIAR